MRLSTALLSILPALAAAQESSAGGAPEPSLTTVTGTSVTTLTTTTTDTTHLTKTITLSRVATILSTINGTERVLGTGTITPALPSASLPVATTSSASGPGASAVPSKGPANAGAALDAGKVALAGVAGMLVAALL
ncbi:hypothetical protein IF1G_00576 [Cordyceps javanica]|uniref:Uncharacterized protein n=1 Tax=Cordyceps javanica TaxID=43265 RepID=A0A545VFY9_9HYPO|nr:hypothetical protein IF1G_00576 [Cordyceps javanica]TQW11827.1 hypothetical protein IF2G_00558 [Cordyceps javanica]